MDWLMGLIGLVVTLSLMWSAYCAGRIHSSLRCRRLLRRSYRAQRQEMEALRQELVDAGCIKEPT